MSKEFFWGDSLTGTKKEVKWNPSLDDEDDFDNLDSDGIQHFLFLKQAVLGATAKEGERNVVEIETENFDGDNVKQPLFSLKLGLNESSPLDIGIQPPVTFILTAGSGPVFLSGQHMIEISADDEEELEEDDEEEEEEDEVEVNASPDLPVAKSKKRPLSTSDGTAKKTKMAKLDKDADKKEDDDEEEDDEEEDEVMAMMDDDEDDEDDEDFEGGEDDEEEDEEESDEDEDDEDDNEEEEEEDEDEESPEKPLKTTAKGKKGQMNGTTTAKGDNKPKAKAKTDTKLVKGKAKKKVLALDEIKGKLQESSNVPKKEEKFKNYVRSAFHISEAKKLQDLWGWFRASLQK
nr:nucleolar protein [Patiria pectinifera]